MEHSLYLKPKCIPNNLPDTTDYTMPNYEFLDELRELFIGEWRSTYFPNRYGDEYMVCDGMEWSVDIEYSNREKPIHYGGPIHFPIISTNLKGCLALKNDLHRQNHVFPHNAITQAICYEHPIYFRKDNLLVNNNIMQQLHLHNL